MQARADGPERGALPPRYAPPQDIWEKKKEAQRLAPIGFFFFANILG